VDTNNHEAKGKIMAKKFNQKYDDHFKTQAVRLAEELGPSRAAKQLGLTMSILQYWRKVHQVKKKISKEEQAKLDREELLRLRKETAEQKQVILILKKAAAFFSNDQQK
jgi:transposase